MADVPVADPLAEAAPPTSQADHLEAVALRSVLSDTYTFVRSAEVNKTILSFTFDHYIDEAMRRIKEDRVLNAPSDSSVGVGKRLSQLNALTKLEQDFNNAFSKLRESAAAKDATPPESP